MVDNVKYISQLFKPIITRKCSWLRAVYYIESMNFYGHCFCQLLNYINSNFYYSVFQPPTLEIRPPRNVWINYVVKEVVSVR
jgi:hypothetical protein